MDMQKQYKESYDDIVLREEKIEQLKDFEQLKKWEEQKRLQKRTQRIRKVLVAAAAVAVVFLAGNTITYAKTGESLVKHTERAIWIVINQESEIPGTFSASIEEDGGNVGVVIFGDDKELKVSDAENSVGTKKIYTNKESNFVVGSKKKKGTNEETYFIMDVKLEQRGDKIYLVVADDAKEKIDITEDFADGEATGEFSVEGMDFRYKVTGDIDKYDIDTEQI